MEAYLHFLVSEILRKNLEMACIGNNWLAHQSQLEL